ncbi:putative 30S ribosomal subunnit protein S21 [Candidatus Zinderia insecticola CARI]|uniref:Small ribosomal subunit protein bS21 n=1 Tax=Zinderia insecticola (strain CARI) TaxID=871271 RepID=E0TIT4_ZINIC|nr:putative 30S ribosomal subunnit protein S21 [Candidatus Zinderia insecticola CARI]
MIIINLNKKENIETVIKNFKNIIDKIGILNTIKLKEFYEKPNQKKKRKLKEIKKKNKLKIKLLNLSKINY